MRSDQSTARPDDADVCARCRDRHRPPSTSGPAAGPGRGRPTRLRGPRPGNPGFGRLRDGAPAPGRWGRRRRSRRRSQRAGSRRNRPIAGRVPDAPNRKPGCGRAVARFSPPAAGRSPGRDTASRRPTTAPRSAARPAALSRRRASSVGGSAGPPLSRCRASLVNQRAVLIARAAALPTPETPGVSMLWRRASRARPRLVVRRAGRGTNEVAGPTRSQRRARRLFDGVQRAAHRVRRTCCPYGSRQDRRYAWRSQLTGTTPQHSPCLPRSGNPGGRPLRRRARRCRSATRQLLARSARPRRHGPSTCSRPGRFM
jgi:hypothetical protein